MSLNLAQSGSVATNMDIWSNCVSNEQYLSRCRAVKSTKGKVISDKDLEVLLDRSDLLGKFYDI